MEHAALTEKVIGCALKVRRGKPGGAGPSAGPRGAMCEPPDKTRGFSHLSILPILSKS